MNPSLPSQHLRSYLAGKFEEAASDLADQRVGGFDVTTLRHRIETGTEGRARVLDLNHPSSDLSLVVVPKGYATPPIYVRVVGPEASVGCRDRATTTLRWTSAGDESSVVELVSQILAGEGSVDH